MLHLQGRASGIWPLDRRVQGLWELSKRSRMSFCGLAQAFTRFVEGSRVGYVPAALRKKGLRDGPRNQ